MTKSTNRIFNLIHLLLLIPVIIIVILMLLPKKQISLKLSDFTSQSSLVNINDASVSTNAATNNELVMVNSPTFTLTYGRYDIACKFKSSVPTTYFQTSHNVDGVNIYEFFTVLCDESGIEHTTMWVRAKDTYDIIFSIDNANDFVIEGVTITATNYPNVLFLLVALLVLVISLIIHLALYKGYTFTKENLLIISGLLLTTIIASVPLLSSTLVEGFDTNFHINRIVGIRDGLLSGQFPVRINPLLYVGFGYADPIFYGNVFLYFPALLSLMGFTIQNAYKIFIFSINLFTAIASYYCLKNILKNKKMALVGCILFTLSPYRFGRSYFVGAVGEMTSLAFLPLIVSGLWNIYNDDINSPNYKYHFIMPAIGYWGVINSHIISTEIYGASTILLCLIMWKKTFTKPVFKVLLSTVIASILLSLNFLYPFISSFLTESVVVNSNMNEVMPMLNDSRVPLSQIFTFFIPEMYAPNWLARMPYQALGLAFGIALLISIPVMIKKGYKDRKYILFYVLNIIYTILALSFFPWNEIIVGFKHLGRPGVAIANALANVQFPYRYLSVGTIFFTIVACMTFIMIDKSVLRKISAYVVIIVSVAYFAVASTSVLTGLEKYYFYDIDVDNRNFSSNMGLWEYYPTNNNVVIDPTLLNENYVPNNCEVTYYNKDYNNITITTKLDEGVEESGVMLPLFSYKGYVIKNTKTNEYLPVNESQTRQLVLKPQIGENTYRVYYKERTSWIICDIITFLSFAGIILAILRIKYPKGTTKNK